ncbi:MAG TPA: DUF885 family protein, partial [Phenylobacterium sp.]|nr:DUF885 family protein [Phenylobacterium sp.]
MRIWPLACLVVAIGAGAPAAAQTTPPSPATAADARFEALYKREWAWRMNEFPERERGDAPVPDRLPKVDPASEARRLAYWQAVRIDLDAIPEAGLSESQRINYSVYRDQIDVLITQQKFHEYEKPFNSDSSFWSGLGFTASRKFHTAQDYRNYIALLNDVPRYFREQQDEMRAGLKRGFTPPRATLVGRDASVSIISEAKSAEATNLWKPFKAYPASVTPPERAQFEAEAKQAIESRVMPAYATLLTFLRQDYVPHTAEALGAEALPDGKAYYRAQIKEFTTLDMEPEAIHQLGLSEVAKIHAQMLDVMKETGFKGDFPAFLTFLRTDPQFYVKDPQDLLNRAAWIAKRVDGKASQ